MSDIVFLHPRLRSEVPVFVFGSFFAYEDLLGAFSAVIGVKPAGSGPPLNTVAITTERLIAFDIHAATEATVSIPLSAVTGISTPDDARAGRVRCITPQQELQLTELLPEDALFIQDIVYNAAAGRLYRAGPTDPSAGSL